MSLYGLAPPNQLLEENLKSVLNVRTAGDPSRENVRWTDLSPREIAEKVTKQGTTRPNPSKHDRY